MNKIKKTIAILLIGSQIGCANQVMHSSLSNAQFDPSYTYKIHTNQNIDIDAPGGTMQNLPDRLYLNQNGQTKYLLHSQVTSIEGESYRNDGNYALEGAGVGAMTGGLLGVISIVAAASSDGCYDSSDCASSEILGGLLGAAIGVIAGGGIGMAIGTAIPKKNQIQITPTFSSSSNNMGAGANVSVRF